MFVETEHIVISDPEKFGLLDRWYFFAIDFNIKNIAGFLRNRTGDNTPPCGTPFFTNLYFDLEPLNSTQVYLPLR